ncbi:hypothetical protein SERV_ORF36 [short-finned eel virus]|uniref:Uncharacterized protein n=1 Tax=short-finned eel virus TaxID=2848076 RepID=A0A192GQI3_FRG3V|nr:hypothetical protein SERV_ORF36 [Short-finned eel ranavirus]ANK58111.1 hypothetical protein SERV_ORF36 [Short-finned eel ranavirus]
MSLRTSGHPGALMAAHCRVHEPASLYPLETGSLNGPDPEAVSHGYHATAARVHPRVVDPLAVSRKEDQPVPAFGQRPSDVEARHGHPSLFGVPVGRIRSLYPVPHLGQCRARRPHDVSHPVHRQHVGHVPHSLDYPVCPGDPQGREDVSPDDGNLFRDSLYGHIFARVRNVRDVELADLNLIPEFPVASLAATGNLPLVTSLRLDASGIFWPTWTPRRPRRGGQCLASTSPEGRSLRM